MKCKHLNCVHNNYLSKVVCDDHMLAHYRSRRNQAQIENNMVMASFYSKEITKLEEKRHQ